MSFTFPVTLQSCLYNTALFRIDNTTAGGMVYVRNDEGARNLVISTDGSMIYECPFEECDINWVSCTTVYQHNIGKSYILEVHWILKNEH